MASEVIIRNRGLYHKALNFDVLVGNDLSYGMLDGSWRLQDNVVEEGPVVIYKPDHIGRGIEVLWKENCKDRIKLSMPLPCTIHDMDVLYKVTSRIMNYWGVDKFSQDGNVFNLEVIDALKKSYIDYCIRSLKEIKETLHGSEVFVMLCARNPLYLSTDQLVEFGEDQDMEGFSLLLHEKQERDLYYASPSIYHYKNGTYFGAYAIVADTDSILPYTPHVPVMAKDPATGEDLQCAFYVAGLNSLKQKKNLGTISYSDFLKEIDVSKLEKYDEAHFILPGLSEEEIKRIAQYGYPNPLDN